MSDAPTPHDDDGPHEGPIRTPKQLILAVVAAFVVPIAVIVLLATYVGAGQRSAAGSDALKPEAIAQRLQPVGMVEVKDASDLSTLKTGEQVFHAQCASCHTAGVLNAPKFGDKAAWAPRIKTGVDALVHSAIAGKGQMPPQGGGDFGDLEIARAVVYMANQGGADFAEPKPPAAAASAQAAAPVAAAPAVDVAAAIAAASAGAAAKPKGEAVPALYTQLCQTCHATGVAGAPKLGNKADWAERAPLGLEKLTAIAIKGKGAMPPKGGSTASEAEIKAVVAYMLSQVK